MNWDHIAFLAYAIAFISTTAFGVHCWRMAGKAFDEGWEGGKAFAEKTPSHWDEIVVYRSRRTGEFIWEWIGSEGKALIEQAAFYDFIREVQAEERQSVLREGAYFTSVVHDCCVELQKLRAES